MTQVPAPIGPPAPSSDPRWTAFVYGGKPLYQALQGAKGTGVNDSVRWNDMPLAENPTVGGGLQYEINPHFAARLEGWRTESEFDHFRERPGGSGYRAFQKLLNVSPSLQGRYPMGKFTPYAGAGPVMTQTTQWDTTGESPPSFDMGGQAYVGGEYALTPEIRAMLEMKYHRSKLQPPDPQGQINGLWNDLALFGGLGYRFDPSALMKALRK